MKIMYIFRKVYKTILRAGIDKNMLFSGFDVQNRNNGDLKSGNSVQNTRTGVISSFLLEGNCTELYL